MKILQRDQFTAMPWPNGGGVAHEIFLDDVGWRLSLADVVGRCDFSRFAGRVRNTTVVSGDGMDLVGEDVEIALRPCAPVAFSGELPLVGTLIGGAVKNLNLVYDRSRVTADIRVVSALVQADLACDNGEQVAVFMIEGAVVLDGVAVQQHGAALFEQARLGESDGVFWVARIKPVE